MTIHDDIFLRMWTNRDGTFTSDHISLEEVQAQADMCSRFCSCWRHRLEAILAYHEEVFK